MQGHFKHRANPLIKRNLLANFIEFILIRAQLDFDPGFERGTKMFMIRK